MAQTLKEEVRESIREAARVVFARKGYRAATVADIAAEGRLSAGNVYRYFASKDALFYDVVDGAWVARFRALLRGRMTAATGVRDLGVLPEDSPYRVAAEAIVAFSLAHRREVIIVLGRAEGSRYETVAEEVTRELVALALAYAGSLSPPREPTETMRFALTRIYGAFVQTMVAVLATYTDEADVRAALADFGRYHIHGLAAFFGSASAEGDHDGRP